MTANKSMVEKCMDGFRKRDHELLLSCLTDDHAWEMPGALHLLGKEAFNKAIENDAFVGSPDHNHHANDGRKRGRSGGRRSAPPEKDQRTPMRSILPCMHYPTRQEEADDHVGRGGQVMVGCRCHLMQAFGGHRLHGMYR